MDELERENAYLRGRLDGMMEERQHGKEQLAQVLQKVGIPGGHKYMPASPTPATPVLATPVPFATSPINGRDGKDNTSLQTMPPQDDRLDKLQNMMTKNAKRSSSHS